MTAHLSPLTLHRLRYGELSGADAARARAHLSGCAACAGRLRGQEHERAAFVARPVPDALRTAAKGAGRARWPELRGLLFALLAAGAVFLVVPRLHSAPEADRVQVRGQLPEIEAWVDRGDGPRLLRDGERLAAGNRVNLAYDPHGASSVAIAGRDGSGAVEVYTTNAPTGVGLVRAPFALALDDTPGTQELFVVTSEAPLDEGTVRAALSGEVDGVHVSRLAIEKDR